MSDNWGVELARMTVFSTGPVTISDQDWLIVTGETEAQSRQAFPGGKRFSGPVPGGTLHLSGLGNRFDIVLTIREDADFSGRLPLVGPLEETLAGFSEITSEWIKRTNPSANRVAFGAVFLEPANNRMDSYERIRRLLKSVNVDPVRMQDLIYRVNWPRSSECVANTKINRISTWGALKFVNKAFQLTGESIVTGSPEELFAVRLEVDHNTDDQRVDALEPEELLAIYAELVDLARENVALGEVL